MSEIVRGRQHRFKVTALNIEVHPHSEDEVYDQLFAKLFEMSQVVEIHGDRLALMTGYEPRKDRRHNDRGYIRGTISTFIDLDATATWFSISTKKKVDEEAARKNIRIPPDYRPNTADFEFLFDPKVHIFICQEKSEVGSAKKVVALSAGLLVRYFETLFKDPHLKSRFGELNVYPVPDTARVEEMIKSPTLKKLHVRVRKPNPDVLDLRDSLSRRLGNMNADELQEIVSAIPGDILRPDQDLADLARVAALSGEVMTWDRDPSGRSREQSTQSVPASFEVRYHKSAELISSVMTRVAEFAIDQINRFKARFASPPVDRAVKKGRKKKPVAKSSTKRRKVKR